MCDCVTHCSHLRDALDAISNQSGLVRQGIKFLRPHVKGLSQKALVQHALELKGMIAMYQSIFGYGHDEIQGAKALCRKVLGDRIDI
jgi:hypothetical protein